MTDRVFLDTDVVVYAYSSTEPTKREPAPSLIQNNNSYISTQVLQEFSNTLIRKFKLNLNLVESLILETATNNIVFQNSFPLFSWHTDSQESMGMDSTTA